MTSRICAYPMCRQPFTTGRMGGVDYCSAACKRKAHSARVLAARRENGVYRVCPACDGGFLATTGRRTCSAACEREMRARNGARSHLVLVQPRWRVGAAAALPAAS